MIRFSARRTPPCGGLVFGMDLRGGADTRPASAPLFWYPPGMAQRRHHYEQAFEEYLRARRIPYVAVNEARKALLPSAAPPSATGPALKSFDFVIYGESVNLLIEIKGRKVARCPRPRPSPQSAREGRSAPLFPAPARRGRLESWVTEDDIASLTAWQGLFGQGFEAAFVFVYWCDEQPPDGLFQEILDHRGRWYAVRAITLGAYTSAMRPRSTRWRTVHVPTAAFERLSQPLAFPPGAGDPGPDLAAFDPRRSTARPLQSGGSSGLAGANGGMRGDGGWG